VLEENFLLNYLKLQQGTEIPQLFATWCGISGVSAVLSRRIWLDMGTYTIFPNFYIVLVASSGRQRKSTAISQIESMLRKVQPPINIIAQKITPEGLIDAMRVKEVTNAKQLFRESGEGFVLADELSAFLNKASYEAGLASLLTTFYDCKANFEYRTKGGGSQKISNICLGMLAASTVDWITNAIPESAVGGGLTSRIVFVLVEKPNDPVAITTFTDEQRELIDQLQKALDRIATLEGQVQLTNEAWKFYKQEYEQWYNESGEAFYSNSTLSGYASRRHMHLLKLGMVLSVCERPDLTITATHLRGAKALLEQCELHMPRVLSLITSTEQGNLLSMLEGHITRAGSIAKPDLLRLVSHKVGSRDLDLLMETLIHSGKVVARSQGSYLLYQWVERGGKD
jgi:hypothetical protein